MVETQNFIRELKQEIIKVAVNLEEDSSVEDIDFIIKGISRFSALAKVTSPKKQP